MPSGDFSPPSSEWQQGYDAGYREAQEDVARAAHTLDLDSPETVERLARALHEASGTHSMTPMRMLCTKPLHDAHRLMAERILAALREETLGS